MKTKIILLFVCLAAFGSISSAQKKTAAITPEAVVKNLYAAQKAEKTNPFTQIKSRTLVDKYFTKDFADLIWKTNSSETGWNVDPLYNAQDIEITDFVVGKSRQDGGLDNVYVKTTFKNFGKMETVGFVMRREANKQWKIDNIDYSDGEDLASIIRYSTDMEFQKEFDANQTFKGSYMIGAVRCDVMPTMNSMFHRVTCENKEGFKLYAVDGNENETSYIHVDDNGKDEGKFVFKNGENDGTYFDAAGKEMKVTRIKDGENPGGMMEESENENVSGELQVGKTKSLILYVGMETGDYAAYCFMNDSDAGRAILAKCKDKEQCEVTATLGDGDGCEVPGLEASLSASFTIATVISVKSLGKQK